MSLIITKKYKRAKAQDAAAMDAQFKVGDRVVSIKTGRKGKIVSPGGRYNPMYGHYGRHEMWNVLFDDEKERIPVLMGSEEIRLANSHSTDTRDSIATDAKFQKGDKVRVWQHPVYGKLGEVVEATNGSMEYTVNVEGKDYPRIDYRRIVKVSNAAGDAAARDRAPDGWWEGKTIFAAFGWGKSVKGKVVSHKNGVIKLADGTTFKESDAYDLYAIDSSASDAAEFHVGQRVRAKDPSYEYSEGKSLGAGMFTVKEVNNNGDVKLDDYGDVWISPSALVEANDACEDSAAKFRIGQEVIVKTKFAEPYKARIVGLWDMSQNGPYNEQGYLIKNIKGGGVESMPEHALSLATAKDSAELNNDACGKGEDANNDFANRIMPLVRKIADAQKVIEGVLGEAEELGYEAAHGEFPDSTFAKKSANQLEAACYEAVTALRKVKTIVVL